MFFSLKGALGQGASVEGEACAAMTSCSETLNQDTEASGLKTEEPKLLNLAGRETLTPAQLKVGVFLSVGL